MAFRQHRSRQASSAVVSHLLRCVTTVSLTVVALAGCGPTAPAQVATQAGALAQVAVTGDATKEPTVTIASAPLTVTGVEKRILTAGSGPALQKSDLAAVQLQVHNGTNGSLAMSTWGGRTPGRIDMSSPGTLPILIDQLEGARQGERLLFVALSSEAFGPEGNPPLGLEPTDPAVFVIDVVGVSKPLPAATGVVVAPRPGLPTVLMDGTGPPRVRMPQTSAPESTLSQPLVSGRGQKVVAGQLVRVAYTGYLWASGKRFAADSSLTTPIGTSQSLPGWDRALVGQSVGSRLLLVVPPAEGYGPQGKGDVGGTDTMVFVIDVLAAI